MTGGVAHDFNNMLTVITGTTETLVAAANRLVDELPEGTPATDVSRHWIATAKADDVLLLRPGTDAALALALMHVICEERLHDAAFVEQHTLGFGSLAQQVKAYSPAWAEGVTGIAAQRIVELARRYAATRPAMIVLGGSSMHKGGNGWQASRAIACLPALETLVLTNNRITSLADVALLAPAGSAVPGWGVLELDGTLPAGPESPPGAISTPATSDNSGRCAGEQPGQNRRVAARLPGAEAHERPERPRPPARRGKCG